MSKIINNNRISILFRCSEALELLKPIVTQYRKDGWKILLKAALHLALKCAFLEAAIPDYVAFGLELGTIHILRKHLYGSIPIVSKYQK